MATNGDAFGAHVAAIVDDYSGESNLERVTGTAPVKVVQGAADTFRAGFQIGSDIAEGDLQALGRDSWEALNTALGFADEAAGVIGGLVADPIGWLISNGVSFLLSWIEPLNELLELVTGDSEALDNAATAFNRLGADIEKLRVETEQLLSDGLSDWEGPAAAAAGKALAEFRDGMSGTAGATGQIAALLSVSSAVMTVVKDVISSIISDLVEWMIVTWLAALAASTVTLGGSVAGAEAATAAEAGMATSKGSRWVQRLQSIIDKLKGLIDKIKAFITRIPSKLVDGTLAENVGKDAARAIAGGEASVGKTIIDKMGGKLGKATIGALEDTVYAEFGNLEVGKGDHKFALPDVKGIIDRNTEIADEITETVDRRGATGEPGMSDEEIDRKLDF